MKAIKFMIYNLVYKGIRYIGIKFKVIFKYSLLRNIHYTLMPVYLYTFLLTFAACEEVIEVDLNSTESKLVIEGIITDQQGPYIVKISKTTDYFVPSDYPIIRSAQITISDDAGFIEHLTETEPGIYKTDSLIGMPGKTYFLNVMIDGQTYSAQSTMPAPLEIDSLTYEKSQHGFGDNYNVICNFQDAAGYKNFGRIKIYQNNDNVNKIFLFNDRLFDGNYIRNLVRHQLEQSDKVTVELWSIDESTYKYYSTLRDAIAADGGENPIVSSTPANPVSNISGNVLGYFGAFTVRTDSVLIR